MRILIFGGNGMLGHKMAQALGEQFETYSTIRGSFEDVRLFRFFSPKRIIGNIDVSDHASVDAAIKKTKPAVVINAVGIIKQIPSSKDVTRTLNINSIFPHRLAELSAIHDFRLITFSTDCVFSGRKGNYGEDDIPDAVDLYGQSKHWGEVDQENCLTIRTSMIGRELKTRHGLAEWFISQRGSTVNGYSRAVFSGFPTVVLADIIVDIIENHRALSGVFHVSSEPINKFDLLTKVNSSLGLGITLIDSEDLVIDRSLDSARFRGVTGFKPQSWDMMIERFAVDSKRYDK